MLKAFIKNAEFGISLLFIFVAICLAYIAIPAFGNKALIVRSGSMEPTVKVGDLVVVQTQHGLLIPQPLVTNIYKEGDIIAFKDSKNPKIVVTHRIVGKEVKDGKVFYQTQGDANNAKDTNLIPEGNIVGKAMFSVAGIGKIFAFAKSKYGFVLMIAFPALMVIVFEIANIINEIKKQKSAYQTQAPPAANAAASLKTLIPLALSIFIIHNSLAYFSDTGTSNNNIFTAAESFGADHIVISEVQITGGPEHTNDDFIELYNPTSSSVNLGNSGYSLVKRSGSSTTDISIKVFTSSNIIPAHGFFLWANSGFSTISATPDVTTTDILASSNSIALKDASGTVIDALSWNSAIQSYKEGTEFSPDPGANQSMERKALSTSDATSMASGSDVSKGNGFDSDNNATDFVLRLVSQPQNSSSGAESP